VRRAERFANRVLADLVKLMRQSQRGLHGMIRGPGDDQDLALGGHRFSPIGKLLETFVRERTTTEHNELPCRHLIKSTEVRRGGNVSRIWQNTAGKWRVVLGGYSPQIVHDGAATGVGGLRIPGMR
jgi:hypothetical protein